ncbi:FecR family protein [Croceibacterium xixiisoli]|nr:FecR domain-containing protein [Croceibacterium xixiisoli]
MSSNAAPPQTHRPADGSMAALMADAGQPDPAMAEAVDWVVHLTSGEATHDDLQELDAWRAATPANDAAYRALAALHPLGAALKGQSGVSRRAMLSGGAVSLAAIGAIGLARPPLGLWPSFSELMADHRTGPGQRFAFRPIDGVDVELNSRTSVALVSSGEGMRLIDGETFVAVANGTPFDVQAGEAHLRANGASFNVQTLAGGIRVACVAGEVLCGTGGTIARLASAQEWRLAANGRATTRPIDEGAAGSWRNGILRFERAPLAEVIEQFNRYRARPVMLASSAIGAQPVSGFFHTSDIDAAVSQLQALHQLNVRHLPGGVILVG